MAFLDNTKIDFSFKILNGKALTSLDKKIYEETRSSTLIVHSNDVWTSNIDSNPAIAEAAGMVQKFTLLPLTEDFSVPDHKGWYAGNTNWVPPRFGQGYTVRLYDNNNVEIPSSDSMDWIWEYNSGYLYIQNTHSFATPFKITGYVYIGNTLSTGVTFWENPVAAFGDLPTSGNTDGDIRYVKDLSDATYGNRIYRWNSATSTWVMVAPGTHFHDDRYYTESELDPTASIGNNVLDDRYYTESELINGALDVRYYTSTEVNVFFDKDLGHTHNGTNGQGPKISYNNLTDLPDLSEAYWKAPVTSESSLPASGNADGDVRLVLNTSDIFRWNSGSSAWQIVSAGVEKWRLPVPNIGDLPLTGNSNGDSRLVLDENILYRWNQSSSEWVSITVVRWQEDFNLSNGQTVINLTNSYVPGNNEILVFLNGILGRVNEDYAETSSTSVTLAAAGDDQDRVTIIGNSGTSGYHPLHSYEENVVDATEAANDEIETTSVILPTSPNDVYISPSSLRSSNILVDVLVDGIELYDDNWRYFYNSSNTKKLIKFSGTGFGGYNLQENENIKVKVGKF